MKFTMLKSSPGTSVSPKGTAMRAAATGLTMSSATVQPIHTQGQYYLTAWTNSTGNVFQVTLAGNVNPDDPAQLNGNNYKARPITVLLNPPPDLTITHINVPARR